MLYPADPPAVEEIVAVMRRAADNRHGRRLQAVIVVLWRGGLRGPNDAGKDSARSRHRRQAATAAERAGESASLNVP
jgi:hypothetical protein